MAMATTGSSPSPIPDLITREIKVLRHVAQGLSDREIAEALGIEKSTVRSHISTILSTLGMTNCTQATLYAIEMGLGRPKDKS